MRQDAAFTGRQDACLYVPGRMASVCSGDFGRLNTDKYA
jgi:hypothetical protein